MVEEIFLQNWIVTKFVLPFLLIFFIVFAILEKTKVFGDDKKQTNALIAFVMGLIFIGVAYPKEVVGNLILFLTVALVVVFVVLLLWGFATGNEPKFDDKGFKIGIGVVAVIATIAAVIWATGLKGGVIDLLFYQSWSSTFWVNALFVVVIAVALALVLKNK